MKIVLLFLSLAGTIVACGSKTDDVKAEKTGLSGDKDTAILSSTESIADDLNLSTETIQTLTDESLESLSAQEDVGASLAVADVDKSKSFERNCAVDGSNAKVTLKATFDRSSATTGRNGKLTLSRQDSGSTDRTRLWSRVKDGKAIAVVCSENNKTAKIDWRDVEGLNLAVTFKSERNRVWNLKNSASGKETKREVATKSEGTRTISWKSVESSNNAAVEIRHKEVRSKVTRSLKTTDKIGNKAEIALSIATKESNPLIVAVERLKTDYSLVSKTIKEGVFIGTLSDKGRVESSYDNFKVSYSDGKCAAVSGSVTYSFFKVDATEAAKVLKLTVDASGNSTLFDEKNSQEIDDFEMSGCDPVDVEE